MLDDSKVLTGKMAKCMRIRCIYHAKQARYQVSYYPDDNLLVMRCLECLPGTEVARFKLTREEGN